MLHVTMLHTRTAVVAGIRHLVPCNTIVRLFHWQPQTIWCPAKFYSSIPNSWWGCNNVTFEGWWATSEFIPEPTFLKPSIPVIAGWPICLLSYCHISWVLIFTPDLKYLKTYQLWIRIHSAWKWHGRFARSLLEFCLIALQIHDMFCVQFFPWNNW